MGKNHGSSMEWTEHLSMHKLIISSLLQIFVDQFNVSCVSWIVVTQVISMI